MEVEMQDMPTRQKRSKSRSKSIPRKPDIDEEDSEADIEKGSKNEKRRRRKSREGGMKNAQDENDNNEQNTQYKSRKNKNRETVSKPKRKKNEDNESEVSSIPEKQKRNKDSEGEKESGNKGNGQGDDDAREMRLKPLIDVSVIKESRHHWHQQVIENILILQVVIWVIASQVCCLWKSACSISTDASQDPAIPPSSGSLLISTIVIMIFLVPPSGIYLVKSERRTNAIIFLLLSLGVTIYLIGVSIFYFANMKGQKDELSDAWNKNSIARKFYEVEDDLLKVSKRNNLMFALFYFFSGLIMLLATIFVRIFQSSLPPDEGFRFRRDRAMRKFQESLPLLDSDDDEELGKRKEKKAKKKRSKSKSKENPSVAFDSEDDTLKPKARKKRTSSKQKADTDDGDDIESQRSRKKGQRTLKEKKSKRKSERKSSSKSIAEL